MIEIQRVLFTTDFSDYSRYALPYAITMVQKFDATLHALYVVEPPNTPADFAWDQIGYDDLEQAHIDHARQSLEKLVISEVPEEIDTEIAVHLGRSVREILNYAREEDIDMIVMSTHGRSGLEHILFGSTAEKVVRQSPCPVLTIRHPDHS